MKPVFSTILSVMTGLLSVSVLCFSLGIFHPNEQSVFSHTREWLSVLWKDIRYNPAFDINNPHITSASLTRVLDNGAKRYDITWDDHVLYDAYIDRCGKGIRCYEEPNGQIASNSFWYFINPDGLVRFNSMFLLEYLIMVIALYLLPIILLLKLSLS